MQTEWIKWWKDKYYLKFLLLAFLALGISFLMAWFISNPYVVVTLVLCTCGIFAIPMRKMVNLQIEVITNKILEELNKEN